MSQLDAKRVTTIQMCREGKISNKDASVLLNLSIRQVQRLKRKADAHGHLAVLHGNRGRKPINALSIQTEEMVLDLVREELKNFNFAHIRDILEDDFSIRLSYSSVYNLLQRHGIKSPRKHRRKKHYHSRPRKAHFGELVQMDASKHEWFGDSDYCHLHGVIDDATGAILALYFSKEELRSSYVELMLQMNNLYGLPNAIYTDARTVFNYEKKDKSKEEKILDQLHGKRTETQFERACRQLRIPLHITSSPQAKGRIERLWNTAQDRILKDLRRAGIKNMEQANTYLPDYIPKYNNRFAKLPAEDESLFCSSIPQEELLICFSEQHLRKIDNALTFSFKGKKYVLPRKQETEKAPLSAKQTVLLSLCHRSGLKVLVNGSWLKPVELEKNKSQAHCKEKMDPKARKELYRKRSRNSTKNKHLTPWGDYSSWLRQQNEKYNNEGVTD